MITREGIIMYKLLLGTYTKSISEGIYEMTLKDGSLSDLKLYIKANNPTYLAWGKNDELVAVAMTDENAGINIYKDKVLKKSFLSKQTAPCFVSYQDETYYSAFYHEGKIEKYKDYGLVAEMNFPKGAKSHYVLPFENDLWIINLGEDKIYFSTENKQIIFKTKKGQGPRHLVIGENNMIYVLTELSNEVLVLKKEADEFILKQTIKLIGNEKNQSAAIKMSSNKTFIYTSTRGDDFITVLEIKENGLLNIVQTISSYGKHPRDFSLTFDDKYLVVANRDSNSLTLFEVNKDTGWLSLIEKDVYAPEAVSVLFFKEDL